MSVGELSVQHEYIMKYLCRREEDGGLGYRQVDPNVVSADLFIPSVLAEFVRGASPIVWNSLLTKFRGDERALTLALKEKVKEQLLMCSNVATFLNNKRTITFEGETVPLFFVSRTELRGDEDFNRNIFAAVEEMPHNVDYNGVTLQRLRPDISFFLNGIFIGYMELKYVSRGQTAARHGRAKVTGDYLESVKLMAQRDKLSAAGVEADRRTALQMFERGLHIVATDVNETYVLRGVGGFFDEAYRGFSDETLTFRQISPSIEREFKLYPVSSPLLPARERFEETMRNLYSRRMVEKEILYYNFLRYTYKKERTTERGRAVTKRVRTSNRGTLIAPRPKQKFGCDRIMERVKEMLAQERNPDYYTQRLRAELEALAVPSATIDEIIGKREAYSNNKYVYSLLLQYAAGFGKSNIIGWTALQLKDLRHEGAFAYDKILIVVDRLQLRDQLDEMMMNMNIDKSMFVEAVDQQTFVDALSDTADGKRIIVVNIQKFLDLQQAIDSSRRRLRQMRVAFLIDEIHRSNSGESNREMLDVFEKLQSSLVASAESAGGEVKKKNLIIGFTATPTQKVLARFGEFKSDPRNIPLWVPFDSYTMSEAIADGYILDPTKHIIKVAIPMHFELPEGVSADDDTVALRLAKADIYANEERMEAYARFIVNRLVSLVYGKIRGSGKAMLAVTSIPNAIRYCLLIRRLMEEKCRDAKYSRYREAPVAVVYSDNQEYESCASMNGGLAEEAVIRNFKAAKNGLIIVVDKLQTGFDEPKLHTLFLDKEITGVNAIQTISRPNRTCKYKEECHIVDLSWRNVNERNIREAFSEFCGTVISQFNPEGEAMLLDEYWRDMTASEPYGRWFGEFCLHNSDADFCLRMEDDVRGWIRRQFEREEEDGGGNATNEAKRLRRVVGRFAASLKMLEDIYEVDAKYGEARFLEFWQTFCRVYRSMMTGGDARIVHPDIETDDDVPGITISAEPESEGDTDGDSGNGGNTGGSGDEGGDNGDRLSGNGENGNAPTLADLLRRWNSREQLTAEEIQRWQEEIERMFATFRADSELMAYMRDRTFSYDSKLEQLNQRWRRYLRSLTQRPDISHLPLYKQLLADNKDQLVDMFWGRISAG